MTGPTVRRIVLLGTGTGVGKSFVATSLARALSRSLPTTKVIALKPVETGRAATDPAFADAASLEQVCSAPPLKPHPLYGLRDPISPHLAAERESVDIKISSVLQWINLQERQALPYATLHYIVSSAGSSGAGLGSNTTERGARSTEQRETDALVGGRRPSDGLADARIQHGQRGAKNYKAMTIAVGAGVTKSPVALFLRYFGVWS
jgi:AAA domain